MSKIDLVRQEMMKAMKAKNPERKDALSALLSALKSEFINKRADLTEDEENAVVYKEIKEAQETIDTAPKDRTEIIAECRAKIAVWSEFAPPRMGEEEIKTAIQSVLEELRIPAPTAKDKGRIMKLLMPRVKGKADGGLVGKLLDGFLS